MAAMLVVLQAPVMAHDFNDDDFDHHNDTFVDNNDFFDNNDFLDDNDFFDNNDDEDVDIDRFNVGGVDCFAVIEDDNGSEDLDDIFCADPNGNVFKV